MVAEPIDQGRPAVSIPSRDIAAAFIQALFIVQAFDQRGSIEYRLRIAPARIWVVGEKTKRHGANSKSNSFHDILNMGCREPARKGRGMATSFTAQIEAFGGMLEEMMTAIHRGSVQDTSEQMTRRAEGVTAGGTFQEGFVPVVTGELINSFEMRIDGSTIGKGPEAYSAVIDGLELGDIADAVFTAPHARPIEYGFRIGDDDTDEGTGDVDVPGRFFVLGAVQNWPETVMANVKYAEGAA